MKNNFTESDIKSFQHKIFTWYKKNKRDLPWRDTTNPYFILVSEIMLQQTQVSRTIEKYKEFISKFPTLKDLAEAETAKVLEVWSGLGYNRRALWLQEAAKQIVEMGSFPETADELIKLKGIGHYTSKSILIFAFNKNEATVDTNIRRILIAEGFAEESTPEKDLFEIALKLLPRDKSRTWHNALMDYGSLVLTASKTGIKPVTKQSKYDKSNRKFRGLIIKKLIDIKKTNSRKLASELNLTVEKTEELLQKLLKDGLIVKEKNEYKLP